VRTQIVPASTVQGQPLINEGVDYLVTDFLGGHGYSHPGEDQGGPQAYIVDIRTPGGVIEPHYHDVDQFQLVLRGEGSMGQKPLAPGSVHYVDHHTTYGPIVAGRHGLAFFTLRPVRAEGRYNMPQSKSRKTVRSGEFFTVGPDPTDSSPRQALAGTQKGAFAEIWRLAPDEPMPDATHTGPAYRVVLSGSVHCGASELTADSCVFTPAGEATPPAVAGPDGAVLAVLGFPSAMR
jgi:quercetin dioxygenase-like cupin family protein